MTKASFNLLIKPVSKFIHQEYTSGLVLLAGVITAVIWVNSPFRESYHHLWELTFSLGFNNYSFSHALHTWINDGLMAIFFFVIGLELKREFMAGELSTAKKASLPVFAALGGMLFPAIIYFLINYNKDSSHGWGIPMATDIAFALALLSMAGKHIPASVKIFLSALAVADDLGAVLVIAFFYTADLQFASLLIGAILLLVLIIGNVAGIRHTFFYLLIGCGVWVCFLLSGVHATIAGVLVAFTIPARTQINEITYARDLRKLTEAFESEIPNNNTLTTPEQHEIIQQVKKVSLNAETPLQKIEYSLHPWVAFVIMPVFALANSGIVIGNNFFESVLNPVSVGVIGGLVIGKFFGILLFTWLVVKFKIGELPQGASWNHIFGVAMLGGVGFTMSLFISGLAFQSQEMIDQAKYGILIASVISGLLGTILLRRMAAFKASVPE